MTGGSAAFFRASNLHRMDYPFHAALASALRICDEACIVVGQSEDDTRDLVYAEQAHYGADRVKIREETFVFDRGWQEQWWDWCREMTTADWHMYHDADEAILPEHAAQLRKLMTSPTTEVIIFPYIHLYATMRYRVVKGFYDHNGRLGRASAGYRMRNWCSDAHPKWAACQMVLHCNGREVDAHNVLDSRAVWVDRPILHYGWCRTPQALAISQAIHRAWYADGDGLADGHVPEVAAYDFKLAERVQSGMAAPYQGQHAPELAQWIMDHVRGWDELEATLERKAYQHGRH